MSVDEAASIHELLNPPLRYALGASGVLYFPWVVPYTLAAAAIALLYAPFLRQLPRTVGFRLAIAGAVFITGAVGGGVARGGAAHSE